MGERGGVGHSKRDVDEASEGLGEEGLTAASGPQDQYVAFFYFNVVVNGMVYGGKMVVMVAGVVVTVMEVVVVVRGR